MMNNGRILGVIGGLGPMATAYFMERIITMTDTEVDQEHIKMIVYNFPDIPDRTRNILDPSQPSPLTDMKRVVQQLIQQGVLEIAIPCVTAQYYHDMLQEGVNIPVHNGVEELAQYLCLNKYDKVGILATDGTVRSRIIENKLREHGIECVYPDEEGQKQVMSLIYDSVKAGRKFDEKGLVDLAEKLRLKGAQRVILGCTELSVIKKYHKLPDYFLDVIDVMARSCVMNFSKLRKEYEEV